MPRPIQGRVWTRFTTFPAAQIAGITYNANGQVRERRRNLPTHLLTVAGVD
ncbi:MAG: hypothetical protein ABSD67_21930 [Terracidiphilus sp.]